MQSVPTTRTSNSIETDSLPTMDSGGPILTGWHTSIFTEILINFQRLVAQPSGQKWSCSLRHPCYAIRSACVNSMQLNFPIWPRHILEPTYLWPVCRLTYLTFDWLNHQTDLIGLVWPATLSQANNETHPSNRYKHIGAQGRFTWITFDRFSIKFALKFQDIRIACLKEMKIHTIKMYNQSNGRFLELIIPCLVQLSER